ncbi:hypothetical protein BLNAU_15750 [Blattamonas nauphoetae]|uniref:HEAT repeat-containing protein 1 n=1 Tax=Blattamonas nauphoetae TaxID=2049346 RepID=A0ABQ9XEK3_9EUKA|nr:hypothetical protein BLNAU_15750 [Blattamonas nauphoetae]
MLWDGINASINSQNSQRLFSVCMKCLRRLGTDTPKWTDLEHRAFIIIFVLSCYLITESNAISTGNHRLDKNESGKRKTKSSDRAGNLILQRTGSLLDELCPLVKTVEIEIGGEESLQILDCIHEMSKELLKHTDNFIKRLFCQLFESPLFSSRSISFFFQLLFTDSPDRRITIQQDAKTTQGKPKTIKTGLCQDGFDLILATSAECVGIGMPSPCLAFAHETITLLAHNMIGQTKSGSNDVTDNCCRVLSTLFKNVPFLSSFFFQHLLPFFPQSGSSSLRPSVGFVLIDAAEQVIRELKERWAFVCSNSKPETENETPAPSGSVWHCSCGAFGDETQLESSLFVCQHPLTRSSSRPLAVDAWREEAGERFHTIVSSLQHTTSFLRLRTSSSQNNPPLRSASQSPTFCPFLLLLPFLEEKDWRIRVRAAEAYLSLIDKPDASSSRLQTRTPHEMFVKSHISILLRIVEHLLAPNMHPLSPKTSQTSTPSTLTEKNVGMKLLLSLLTQNVFHSHLDFSFSLKTYVSVCWQKAGFDTIHHHLTAMWKTHLTRNESEQEPPQPLAGPATFDDFVQDLKNSQAFESLSSQPRTIEESVIGILAIGASVLFGIETPDKQTETFFHPTLAASTNSPQPTASPSFLIDFTQSQSVTTRFIEIRQHSHFVFSLCSDILPIVYGCLFPHSLDHVNVSPILSAIGQQRTNTIWGSVGHCLDGVHEGQRETVGSEVRRAMLLLLCGEEGADSDDAQQRQSVLRTIRLDGGCLGQSLTFSEDKVLMILRKRLIVEGNGLQTAINIAFAGPLLQLSPSSTFLSTLLSEQQPFFVHAVISSFISLLSSPSLQQTLSSTPSLLMNCPLILTHKTGVEHIVLQQGVWQALNQFVSHTTFPSFISSTFHTHDTLTSESTLDNLIVLEGALLESVSSPTTRNPHISSILLLFSALVQIESENEDRIRWEAKKREEQEANERIGLVVSLLKDQTNTEPAAVAEEHSSFIPVCTFLCSFFDEHRLDLFLQTDGIVELIFRLPFAHTRLARIVVDLVHLALQDEEAEDLVNQQSETTQPWRAVSILLNVIKEAVIVIGAEARIEGLRSIRKTQAMSSSDGGMEQGYLTEHNKRIQAFAAVESAAEEVTVSSWIGRIGILFIEHMLEQQRMRREASITFRQPLTDHFELFCLGLIGAFSVGCRRIARTCIEPVRTIVSQLNDASTEMLVDEQPESQHNTPAVSASLTLWNTVMVIGELFIASPNESKDLVDWVGRILTKSSQPSLTILRPLPPLSEQDSGHDQLVQICSFLVLSTLLLNGQLESVDCTLSLAGCVDNSETNPPPSPTDDNQEDTFNVSLISSKHTLPQRDRNNLTGLQITTIMNEWAISFFSLLFSNERSTSHKQRSNRNKKSRIAAKEEKREEGGDQKADRSGGVSLQTLIIFDLCTKGDGARMEKIWTVAGKDKTKQQELSILLSEHLSSICSQKSITQTFPSPQTQIIRIASILSSIAPSIPSLSFLESALQQGLLGPRFFAIRSGREKGSEEKSKRDAVRKNLVAHSKLFESREKAKETTAPVLNLLQK